MSSRILLSALLLSASAVYSQSNIAMGQEFAELAAHKGLSGKGFAAFQSYKSSDVNGSPYFFPDWDAGEIVTTHNEVFNDEFQFIYDKVRQELFIRQKDSALVLLTNKDEVQSFSLKNGKDEPFHFVNSKLFTDEKPEVYYQVLVYDSTKLTLLKYIKTSYVNADMTDVIKINDGNIYDSYVDKFFYYIVQNGGPLQPVQLKSKSIKKVFGDLGIPYEKYMNTHFQPVDEDYLADMVKQSNLTLR
jgi:hypothetical protein